MDIFVRPLSANDSIAELTHLLHAAYAQLAALGFNYTAVDQSEAVTRERIAQGECYVAAADGALVGTILFTTPDQTHGSPWLGKADVCEFHQFGVLPRYQGSGIGSRLLDHVENRARALSATEIAFNTSEGAHQLIGWYVRRGYRHIEHIQWEGKTYRSVIMSKTLQAS